MYYCRHCSAPKGFIEKASIKLMEKVDLLETPDIKLTFAKQAIEKKAENIIEQTVVAMDAAQEIFTEYKKPATRSSGTMRKRSLFGLPLGQAFGLMLIALVLMTMLSFNVFPSVLERRDTSGDNITTPIRVDVYVILVNDTDGSFYTGYAHFSGETRTIWCTYGSGTQEQGYDLLGIFRTGEVISVSINEVHVLWRDDIHSFTIPMNWSRDFGAYYITLHIE